MLEKCYGPVARQHYYFFTRKTMKRNFNFEFDLFLDMMLAVSESGVERRALLDIDAVLQIAET